MPKLQWILYFGLLNAVVYLVMVNLYGEDPNKAMLYLACLEGVAGFVMAIHAMPQEHSQYLIAGGWMLAYTICFVVSLPWWAVFVIYLAVVQLGFCYVTKSWKVASVRALGAHTLALFGAAMPIIALTRSEGGEDFAHPILITLLCFGAAAILDWLSEVPLPWTRTKAR